jgi:hypothetical protein
LSLSVALSIFFSAPVVADDPVIEVADPFEIRFQEGLMGMDRGLFMEAAKIFEDLYFDTGSPRVKLEWARSLYLGGKKREARNLFREALKENPPMMVRERVNIFLDDIALSLGRVDVAIGVTRDSNPRAVTSDRVISLFGFNFDYNPGVNRKPQNGINYMLTAAKGIDEDNRWVVSASVGGSKFSDRVFDKTAIDVYLTYRLMTEPRLEVKAGLGQFYFADTKLYNDRSLSLKHTKGFIDGANWTSEVKVTKVNYDQFKYLDGPIYSMSSSYTHPVFENIFLGGELMFDRASAVESPYSYRTRAVSLFTNFLFPDYFIKGQVRVVAGSREFDSTDPFFGKVREDGRRGIYINISKTDLTLFEMTPAVEYSFEKNDSNISINSYEREILGFTLKKTF